jgi:hypothetical protein
VAEGVLRGKSGIKGKYRKIFWKKARNRRKKAIFLKKCGF